MKNVLNPLLTVGSVFAMGRIDCVVRQISVFGKTQHYGFTYKDDNGKTQQGWMPCSFVEDFTGYTLPMDVRKG